MKVGDLVRSKAGGPRMVVNAELINDQWLCVWWSNPQNEFKSEKFHTNALKPDTGND